MREEKRGGFDWSRENALHRSVKEWASIGHVPRPWPFWTFRDFQINNAALTRTKHSQRAIQIRAKLARAQCCSLPVSKLDVYRGRLQVTTEFSDGYLSSKRENRS